MTSGAPRIVQSQIEYALDGDELLPQRELEENQSVNLEFHVGPQAIDATMSKETWTGLWWIETSVDPVDGLRIVWLLSVSGHVGRGPLVGTLALVGEPEPGVQHWRITFDPATITGPPVSEDMDFVRSYDHGVTTGGSVEVSIHRRADDCVETIDLIVRPQKALDEPYAMP